VYLHSFPPRLPSGLVVIELGKFLEIHNPGDQVDAVLKQAGVELELVALLVAGLPSPGAVAGDSAGEVVAIVVDFPLMSPFPDRKITRMNSILLDNYYHAL